MSALSSSMYIPAPDVLACVTADRQRAYLPFTPIKYLTDQGKAGYPRVVTRLRHDSVRLSELRTSKFEGSLG